MGTWNAGLFCNDTACDVKDSYIEFLEQQLSNDEAYQKILEEYDELFGTDEEDVFWYALADTQWNVGRLMPEVKEMALKQMEQNDCMNRFEENPKYIARWERVLQKLREKLESPQPPEKRFRKKQEFVTNPWNIGDVYAYQFHTKDAEENGLLGKYILFQKLGDVESYDSITYSVIQMLDRIFDDIPAIEDIKDIRVLPHTVPPGVYGSPDKIEDYVPSFDWYMKATMIYDKKNHYPQKYFTFVGNQDVPRREYRARDMDDFFLSRNGMEYWIIAFYQAWQNVAYE